MKAVPLVQLSTEEIEPMQPSDLIPGVRESRWVAVNYDILLEQYRDMWVAVKIDRVVAASATAEGLLPQLASANISNPYIRRIAEAEQGVHIYVQS